MQEIWDTTLRRLKNQLVFELDFRRTKIKMWNAHPRQSSTKKRKRGTSSTSVWGVRGLTRLEQYWRINNVEIKGIPVTKAEGCMFNFQTIRKKVGCELTLSDINVYHRVPVAKSTNDKNVIVHFLCRRRSTSFPRRKRHTSLVALDFPQMGSQQLFSMTAWLKLCVFWRRTGERLRRGRPRTALFIR